MDISKVLEGNFFSAAGVALCAFFGKAYLNQINKRVTDHINQTNAKFVEIRSSLDVITSKITGVTDLMLEKFSSWEDRIKATLARGEDSSGTIKVLETEMGRDIDDIRGRLNEVKQDIVVFEKEVTKGFEESKNTKENFEAVFRQVFQKVLGFKSKVDIISNQLDRNETMVKEAVGSTLAYLDELKQKQEQEEVFSKAVKKKLLEHERFITNMRAIYGNKLGKK